jgi:hypothetical protein
MTAVADSPVDFARRLPAADKEAVFFALLAEARASGEDAGTLPLDGPTGERVGYFLTPAAWERLRNLPPQTDAQRQASRAALLDLDDTLSPEEVAALLNPQAGPPAR